MIEIGNRAKRLPPPPHVVWSDLVAPRATGIRAWLRLHASEVAPLVLDAENPTRVLWSTLWPERPGDLVHLTLEPHREETLLRFRLLTPGPVPDEPTTRHLRHRLNHLLFADLRESYG